MGNQSKRGKAKKSVPNGKVVDLPTQAPQGPILDQERFSNKLQMKYAQSCLDMEAKDTLIEQLWEENQQLKSQIDPLAQRVAALEEENKSDESTDSSE